MKQYFKFNGLLGFGIGGALLLVINVYIIVEGIMTQRAEASNYYEIDSDINALKTKSIDNQKYYIVK
jgi:hypothetical protein